jgi:ATP-dependent Clp protease ATP-binding subunit ClpC
MSDSTEFFDEACVDLVAEAVAGRLPAVHGRDEEAHEVASLLRDGRSVLLVGPTGGGKTAIVNRVAALLAADSSAPHLYSITTAQIIATPQGYIGQWQSQLQAVLGGVKAHDGILYYTDLWLTPGAGRTASSEDNIWDCLAPLIERRQLTLLAECQPDVVKALNRRIPGMLDRFVHIAVDALPEPRARAVLLAHARALSASASAAEERWSDDAVARAHEITDHFQPYRAQPGKGIALIDRVVHYRREKLRRNEDEPISVELVERVFSVYSGLPLFILSDAEPLRRADAIQFFRQHIIGQDQAIEPLVDAIALYKAGLNDPRRPIASFLFVGPTGVGKTELARTLAKFLFGSPERLLRLDMSEYRDYHGYQLLVGDPNRPDERAHLCDPLMQQPFQVVLLDEFEKGHENVADLMLQVLDAGRLTTPRGVVVDFTSAIVILTSNLGSDLRRGQIGLRADDSDERASLIDHALEHTLRPEFLNRLDRVVHFRALDREQLRLVARRELQLVAERRGVRGRRVTLDVDGEVIDHILEHGIDRKYGARGLRRAIERHVAVPVALALVERRVQPRRAGAPPVTERVRVRLDAERRVAVDVYSDEPEAAAAPRPSPPTRVSGAHSGLKLSPAEARERLERVRVQLVALAEHFGLEQRRRELHQMAETHARPDFWADAARAAQEFARYDRLAFQVRRLDRLCARRDELAQKTTEPWLVDALVELTARADEADLELRHLGLDGDRDEADALLLLRPELGDDGDVTATVLRQLWDMYAGWASSGPRRADLLYVPAEGGITTRLLVGSVSGPIAFGSLRRESGQHRFRLRRGSEAAAGLAVVVRVEVHPVLLEGEAPLAPREVVVQSYALKLTVDEPGGPRRVRSAVLARRADGQLLPLQNERDLTANRVLARRLIAAIDAFPDGARAFTDDPLVRTYDLAAQPLVKDYATGHTSGRVKDILSGDLDDLLRLRIRTLPLKSP